MKILIPKGIGRPDFTLSVIRKSISSLRGQILGKVRIPLFFNVPFCVFTFEIDAPSGLLIKDITLTKIRIFCESNYTLKLVAYERLPSEYDDGKSIIKIWFTQSYEIYEESGLYFKELETPVKSIYFPLWVGYETFLERNPDIYYNMPASVYIDIFAIINYEREKSY